MIYILGGNGFVGSAFAREAARRGLEHTIIGRAEYAQYRGSHCDLLINANGNSRKYLATEDPALDFELSVASVMRSLVDFSAEMYVYISSIAVYEHPGDPERSNEDTPIDPGRLAVYGAHKYLAECLVRTHAPRSLIVRLGGVVGPGMTKGPVYDILAGEPLRVGHTSRFQYIETDAAARAVFALLDAGRERELFNIAGRGAMALVEVQALAGRSGTNDLPPEAWEVDVERAHRLVGLPTTRETLTAFLAGARDRA